MSLPPLRAAVAATALGACGWALAHTGADAGVHHAPAFVAGLLHPFTGLDHLAAMLSVGAWSALTARRWWQAPAAFAALLLAGALLGLGGIALPRVEGGIAASVLVLGLLLALRRGLPAAAAAALVGAFALCHGLAHGTELAALPQPALALAGMLAGTVALHLAGVAAGAWLLPRSAWWTRALGGGVGLYGAALLGGLA